MTAHASALDHHRQGCHRLQDAPEAALQHLRTAHELDPGSARFRSFYGLALGLVERRWDQALALCRSAARDEFFDPVHYHNLARLHLAFGFKAEAIRLLRRGLMIDPENPEISATLCEMGVRRDPPLRFLRRENALNRVLGRLIERGSGRPDPEPTAV